MPLRTVRLKYRERGLCISCLSPKPERKPLPGHAKCHHCMSVVVDRVMRLYREARKNQPDLCPRCKSPMDDDDKLEGTVWCIVCTTKDREYKGRSV